MPDSSPTPIYASDGDEIVLVLIAHIKRFIGRPHYRPTKSPNVRPALYINGKPRHEYPHIEFKISGLKIGMLLSEATLGKAILNHSTNAASMFYCKKR